VALYKSKAEAKRKIQELIDTNDRAVARGILAIYEYQTASEQSFGSTTDANGVGFSGVDAELLSSFAERLKRGLQLTEKQLPFARKKIRKYWNQLRIVAELKASLPKPEPVPAPDDLKWKQYWIDRARAEGLDP
jgi:hypothetical protein